jgi:hypothetical protein
MHGLSAFFIWTHILINYPPKSGAIKRRRPLFVQSMACSKTFKKSRLRGKGNLPSRRCLYQLLDGRRLGSTRSGGGSGSGVSRTCASVMITCNGWGCEHFFFHFRTPFLIQYEGSRIGEGSLEEMRSIGLLVVGLITRHKTVLMAEDGGGLWCLIRRR